MATQNKVLVVGCHTGGLGVFRGLGDKNIYIVAMTYDKADFGYTSRYVSEVVNIPHPRIEEKKFIDFLISNSHKWKDALILDTDDHVAVSISKHKDELAKYYKIVTANWEVLRKFIEKKETYMLAQECNVPHPKTFLPKTLGELSIIKNEINYPCILKPVRGHEFKSKFNTKNFKVNNDTELLDKFKLCIESKQEVIVQEIIPGPDTNIYQMKAYINSKGNMSAKIFLNKIRQNPPQFGVMRVGISKKRNQEVELFSDRLLKHTNFRGFCSVEFKKDPRDDQLKLMEVNVRMTRNIWLATYCGVNFPWIIYMDLVENRQIEIKDYKEDVYYIEFYADLFNSIFRHNKENFTLRDYIKPYLSKNKTFAVFSSNDLAPFLKQTMILPMTFYRFFKLNLWDWF
jgi:predicted ATP-grasp superfamily ATP-dependent carboligase